MLTVQEGGNEDIASPDPVADPRNMIGAQQPLLIEFIHGLLNGERPIIQGRMRQSALTASISC